jgi:hypothetical protein
VPDSLYLLRSRLAVAALEALLDAVLDELLLTELALLLLLDELDATDELEEATDEEIDEALELLVVVVAYEHHTELLGALGKLLRLQTTLVVNVP